MKGFCRLIMRQRRRVRCVVSIYLDRWSKLRDPISFIGV